MANYRFFKCNVLGGFRLSDLNKNVKQGEYFYIDSHVAETSRAAQAALRERWMLEVSEKEATKVITMPREIANAGVQFTTVRAKRPGSENASVATPDVKIVNKNIESRQTENNKLNASKPSIPDFKESEKNTKNRQNDSMNKVGASSDTELTQGLKDTEVAVGPFDKVAEKKEEIVVNALSNDETFDNSLLSTPNFDEKKEEVKEEIKEKLEKKIRRKRRRRKSSEKVDETGKPEGTE